jgi:SAM-dependent methyltransferase
VNQQQTVSPALMYQQYLVPAIFDPWAPVLLGYAAPQPGETVLDVAAGTGAVTRAVAPLLGPGGRVVAADISPAMLEVARSLPVPDGAPVVWTEASADALPGDGYDLVLCQQGFQFFPDCAAAAREMCRVLQPDGRAALAVWQERARQPVYKALFEAEARFLGVPVDELDAPFSFGDADELRGVLAAAGFERVELATETRTVRFPSATQFVALTVLAGAAVIPELADMDDVQRQRLVEAVSRDAAPTLRTFTEGDTVVFPMHANIAVAYA